MTDDFDKLTKSIKLKKFMEYVQKKQEETKRNQMNEKKSQSTAYRPLITKENILAFKNKRDPANEQNNASQGAEEPGEVNGERMSSFGMRNGLGGTGSNMRAERGDQQLSDGSEEEVDQVDLPSTGLNQEAGHAKCILDLSFTKFKWTSEDFLQFHRPDIQQLFDQEQALQQLATRQEESLRKEKTKKNNSSLISLACEGGENEVVHRSRSAESTQSSIFASVPVSVIDRETIKRKHKKKGIINAEEFFKDRFKLSLKDGKFCAFEHIDQEPIFMTNFGMVSKLDRYLYSNEPLPAEEFLPSS